MKRGTEYPFIEMASVGENFAGILGFETRALAGSGLSRFAPNDTLFAKITPCPENGKVAFVPALPVGDIGLGSTEFIVLSPRASTDPRYLYHLLCSQAVRGRAIARMEGSTGRQRVPEDVFTKRLVVPNPGRDEQSAIAEILDSVDVSVANARSAIAKLRSLKGAVLDQFVYSALGETAYADRPQRPLPHGWQLARTSVLLEGEPKNGLSPQASSQPPGVPTFSIGAVRWGRVDLESKVNLKYARVPDADARPYRIARGDVLIVRGNANPDLVGKAGVVGAVPEGCIYPDITKRVVFQNRRWPMVSPQFGVVLWNHAAVHNQVLRRAKTSNGTLKINNRDVLQIVLPVPPEEQQTELVALVGAIEERVEALKAVVAARERLKRSLMDDLFSGRVRVQAALVAS